ncbi:MAG: hypothetical protein AAFQ82_16535, partial [Myxococcota bacterium]
MLWSLSTLSGCGDDAEPLDPCTVSRDAEGVLVVLSTNFEASSLEAVAPGCTESTSNLVTLTGDAVLKVKDGEAIQVLNRGATSSLVTIGESFLVESEVPLAGCNAQEALPLENGDRFVTCYAEGSARLVSGESASVSTDLSVFDPDGIPQMAGAARIGNRIYVALQRLDEGFAPRGPGLLAVIDAQTQTLVD